MTEYLRVKMAERGDSAGAKFMEDGFDRWAESERPARTGQVEKTPAESKMENYGGAMSLSKAKKMQAMVMGAGMCGGAMVDFGAGIKVDVPDLVVDAVKQAKRLQTFIATLDSRLPAIIEETRDNIVLKPDDYSAQFIQKAQDMIGYMQALKGYTATLKNVLAFVQYIPTGSGRHGGKSGHVRVHFGGAATTLERVTAWINYVKKVATDIYNYVKWFAQNVTVVKAILSLEASQPEGQQVIDALGPIWDLMGVVAGKGSGGRACCQCKGGKKSLPILDVNTMTMQTGPKRGGMRMRVVGGRAPPMDMGRIISVPPNMNFDQASYDRMLAEKKALRKSVGLGKYGGMRMEKMPAFSGPQYESNYMGPSVGTAPMRPSEMYDMKMAVRPGPRQIGMGRKPSARGEIVKKVMREQGLSLPQASSYVKQHGLY